VVNVGELQEAMERGLHRFTGANLVDRWNDVFTWLVRVLRSWVQRAKQIKIERVEQAIRIEMQDADPGRPRILRLRLRRFSRPRAWGGDEAMTRVTSGARRSVRFTG
jgi:hypothetical protein